MAEIILSCLPRILDINIIAFAEVPYTLKLVNLPVHLLMTYIHNGRLDTLL